MAGAIEMQNRDQYTPLAVSDNSALTDIESPEASPTNKMTSSTRVSSNTDEIDIVFSAAPINSETDAREIGNGRRRKKGSERSLGEFSRRKSVRNLVRRRLSSFHEQIPVKIQNFLLKYTLFIFNFMSWLGGLGAVAVGTWQLTDDEKVITDAVDFVLDPFIIICIIGAITFTIAFLGCVGAVREHVLLLKSVGVWGLNHRVLHRARGQGHITPHPTNTVETGYTAVHGRQKYKETHGYYSTAVYLLWHQCYRRGLQGLETEHVLQLYGTEPEHLPVCCA